MWGSLVNLDTHLYSWLYRFRVNLDYGSKSGPRKFPKARRGRYPLAGAEAPHQDKELYRATENLPAFVR